MIVHETCCRVIYGDTDKMGVAYHANYLRWFETGRAEMFRHLGLSYMEMEMRGFGLPVTEAWCKYIRPARYDDRIRIRTSLNPEIRVKIRFDYRILRDSDAEDLAAGYTEHAFLNMERNKPVRPPAFFRELIARSPKSSDTPAAAVSALASD